MLRKVDPVRDARTLAASHVRPVHVTRGCTVLVNAFGRFAPKTNVDSVLKRRKDDRSKLIYFDSGEFLIRATVDIPVTQANVFKVRNNVRLNAFGGGLVVGTVDAMISVT